MHVNCPHCHHGIEIVADACLTDIDCPSCGSSFNILGEDPDATLVGDSGVTKSIGRFQLLNEVGVGAFGSVWLGKDLQLDRQVAVKIPRKGQLNAAESEQFFREARAAAQLKHPNIVPVHEIGRDGETIYIVSEFVQGISLADRLTSGPMGMRESAELCIMVASALHHAHEQGVIHRDLKPSNIMLDEHGQPHVMDFGLAKRDTGEITMTVDGQVLGTPAFMSPEQARGSAHDADGRSDLYSVGVILFQLLTGELPFRGNTRMLLHQVIHDDPPSPLKLNPNIDRDLATIALKCMEKDPGKRYRSCEEVANDLKRYLNGEPIAARPVGRIERSRRWCQRKPALASAIGLSVVLLITLAIGGPIAAIRQASLKHSAQTAAKIALDQKSRADNEAENARQAEFLAAEQRDLANQTLYASNMQLAFREHKSSRPSHALVILDQLERQSADPLIHAGPELHYLNRLLHNYVRVFDENVCFGSAVAVCPSGDLVATGNREGIVTIWDMATGKKLVRLDPFEQLDLKLATEELTKIQTDALEYSYDIKQLAFSPDGNVLAIAGGGSWDPPLRVLATFDARTGDVLNVFEGHDFCVNDIAFGPRGQLLASASLDGTVRIWNVEDGKQIRKIDAVQGNPGTWSVKATAFSPDGTLLVSGGSDRLVRVWNVETGLEVQSFAGHTGHIQDVAFDVDGSAVLSCCHGDRPRYWHLADPRLNRMLPNTAHGVRQLEFHPSGRFVLTRQDGALRIWRWPEFEEIRVIHAHSQACAWDELGWRVVCLENDEVQLRDAWFDSLHKKIGVTGINVAFVSSLDFAESTRQLAVVSGTELFTLDFDTHQRKQAFDGHPIMGTKMPCNGAAFLENGTQLLSLGFDGNLRLWEAKTGKPLNSMALNVPKSDLVTQMMNLAVDYDRGVAAAAALNGLVVVIDLSTWTEIQRIQLENEKVMAVDFDSAGNLFVGTNRITQWDVHSGSLLADFGECPTTLVIRCSPDGQLVGAASAGGSAKIWSIRDQTLRLEIQGSAEWITDLAFSSDSRRMVTSSSDGTIRFWDVASGQELLTVAEFDASISKIKFTGVGNNFLTVLQDNGHLTSLDLRPDDAAIRTEKEAHGLAHFLIQRPLTVEEARRFTETHQGISQGVREMVLEHLRGTRDNPLVFNQAAWDIARRNSLPQTFYEEAMRDAEIACRLSPDTGSLLNTLGACRYRINDFTAAIEILEKSRNLNRVRVSRVSSLYDPADSAFLAMSHLQLGNVDQAKQYLDDTRESVENSMWNGNSEARQLLAEAESVWLKKVPQRAAVTKDENSLYAAPDKKK